MRRFTALGTAALLAVIPAAAKAQETIIRETTTVVVKEAPKPSPITFTPYGFFLLNGFFNDAAGTRNYPLPAQCNGGASCEGNVLFDVRQTRLGTRIAFDDTAGWTAAQLSALIEVDFQGGYNGTPSSSFSFYSPVLRLRKAYVDAGWSLGGDSRLTLRLGQDDIVTSPLRPTSLAYIANPLFQYAGTLNGRAPMFAIRYDLNPKDGIAVSAVVAAVNPQDSIANDSATLPSVAVDLGAGNRSRMPSFQGRVGVGVKSGGKSVAALNVWGGIQKDSFVSPLEDARVDQSTNIYGGDLTLNFPLISAMGSIYSSRGWDQPGSLGAAQDVAVSVTRSGPSAPWQITDTRAIKALGGWFQILVGPADQIQLYGGWGGTQTASGDLVGSILAVAGTRVQNYQWAAGVIGYAGKNWRFSAEYSRATSYFYQGDSYAQGQFSVNSQLVF